MLYGGIALGVDYRCILLHLSIFAVLLWRWVFVGLVRCSIGNILSCSCRHRLFSVLLLAVTASTTHFNNNFIVVCEAIIVMSNSKLLLLLILFQLALLKRASPYENHPYPTFIQDPSDTKSSRLLQSLIRDNIRITVNTLLLRSVTTTTTQSVLTFI